MMESRLGRDSRFIRQQGIQTRPYHVIVPLPFNTVALNHLVTDYMFSIAAGLSNSVSDRSEGINQSLKP